MKKTTGKKVYGVAGVSQKDYVKSANETGGGGAVVRPLLNVRGKNATILNGTFELPDIHETKDNSVEFAVRILGMLVTKDLLAHLPAEVSADDLGTLVPFYPLSYHKRLGSTYTDRICRASTRSGKCPACKARMDLFASDAYKNGTEAERKRLKKLFAGSGVYTRQIALVVGRFYYNDEDLGIRAWWTPLTNEEIATARHDKFFDKIAELMSPKKLSGIEALPIDYYANGDGARWLFVEYKRELYSGDDDKTDGDSKNKRGPSPFWQLKSVTCAKELQGVGKAEDIWWPEVEGEDSIETVDIYDLLDHGPIEEIEKASAEVVERILNPKRQQSDDKSEGGEAAQYSTWEGPAPTWAQLNEMDVSELIGVGAAFGGDAEELALVGQANEGLLRRNVCKLCGAKPMPPSRQASASDTGSDDPTPF